MLKHFLEAMWFFWPLLIFVLPFAIYMIGVAYFIAQKELRGEKVYCHKGPGGTGFGKRLKG